MRHLLFLFVSFSISGLGCNKLNERVNGEIKSAETIQSIIALWDYKYKNENYSESVMEIATSPNKKHTIGTYIPLVGHQPEIFSINKDEKIKRLTNSQFIKFSPVINDNGDIAYALSEYSTSISKLYLNGKLVKGTDNDLFYDNLALNNSSLAFSSFRFYDNKAFLNIFDIKKNRTTHINTSFYTQKTAFLSDSILLIQGYNTQNLSNDIYEYNLKTETLRNKCNSSGDELLFDVQFNKYYNVIIPIANNALFNSIYSLYNRTKNQSFAMTGNDFGRTSWYVSYLMETYLKLYKATGDNCWKEIINENINHILNTQNEDMGTTNDYNPSFLWSAKKYSIDYNTPISLLVDNAKILYPLLCAYNENICTKKEIIEIAEKAYDYYEANYDRRSRLYSFQKGIDFWADGVVMPFNQQNAWGLCLLELYKATRNTKYKERVRLIAEKFKSENSVNEEQLTWNYWPEIFYKGWAKESNKSKNTIERAPLNESEEKSDDISHAGISVKFILEYKKQFSDVFNEDDLSKLSKTLDNLILKAGFPRNIQGLAKGENPLLRNVPTYGWSNYFIALQPFYTKSLPYIYPYFDSATGYVYPLVIGPSQVKYKSLTFGTNGGSYIEK